MPTYTYKCDNCGNTFDVQQAITDKSLTQCPKCGEKIHKVYGNVGIVFKGSGFYRTDSKSAGNDKSSS